MNFHPALIAMHIADTTASACRPKPPRLSRALHWTLLLALGAAAYFMARMA